jgi:peptidyl-prolyl cis-trans isomerase B (cyclophilin B)
LPAIGYIEAARDRRPGICSVAVGSGGQNETRVPATRARPPYRIKQKEYTVAKNRKAEVDTAAKAIDFTKNKYQIELDTTLGKITLNMLPEMAPGHCTNMLSLAKIGYYDGLIFHRVIKGFMIQGGCPEGSGTGGPGYTIKAEFNATKHDPGVLSMARTNDPNSAGSQFFICLEKVTHLDGQYTAFGKTADAASLDVVKNIGVVPTSQDRPRTPVTINKATVLATGR